MKKILIVSVVALGACSNLIKNENGSENLQRLDTAPTNCEFLYKIETEASVYDEEDARRYTENRIADQVRRGNAYHVVSVRTKANPSAIFGPEKTYIFTSNVYNCD